MLLLVVGTLPVAVAGAVVTASSYVGDRAQSLARQRQFTEDLVTGFESHIDEEIQDLRTLARLVALAPDDEAQRVAMGAVLARNPTYERVAVLDASATERIRLARSGPDDGPAPPAPTAAELARMQPDQVDVAGPLIDESRGSPSLDVIVRAPLDDPATAAVRAEIALGRPWEQIALRDTVDDAVVFLLDEGNRVVAHANPTVAMSGRVLVPPAKEGFGTGLIGDALVTFEPVTIGNRTLLAVVERPSADVLGSFRVALRARIAGVAATLVVSALVGIYAARRITRPIEMLADTAARLHAGDLGARAQLGRDDEIGLLGDTFDDMAAELGRTIGDLEADVVQRTERLQRSNEELERFATIAAHDLREPLRKVEAFGDRLRTAAGHDLAPDAAHALDRMISSTEHMRAMIDDLLAYATVGQAEAPHAPVDLAAVVAGALDDLEQSIAEAGATVHVGDLPVVVGNRHALRRLFVNLVENAVTYVRPGVAPEVRVSSEELAGPDPAVRLTVADNGIGFDAEHRERIFEVFRRLHAQNAYPGTGIGLSIARRIVEQHGGTITARGDKRTGAAFEITLPGRLACAVGSADPVNAVDGRDQKRSSSGEAEGSAQHRHGGR